MGMVPVTEADGFTARVIAARLGSEGIVCEVRGADGPYPVGQASVWVEEGNLEMAREILLVEEVEASFDDEHAERLELAPRTAWLLVAAVLVVTLLLYARALA